MTADLGDRLAAIEAHLSQLVDRVGAPAPRWLSVDGGAKYCSLSPKSIRNLLASGKLHAHRPVRGRIVIDRIELDTMIAGSNTTPRNGRGMTRKKT